jgi:hypothetical protein
VQEAKKELDDIAAILSTVQEPGMLSMLTIAAHKLTNELKNYFKPVLLTTKIIFVKNTLMF